MRSALISTCTKY